MLAVVAMLAWPSARLTSKTSAPAGSHYTDAIAAGLREAGATIEVPTAGLGLGRQLAWYGTRTTTPAGPRAGG